MGLHAAVDAGRCDLDWLWGSLPWHKIFFTDFFGLRKHLSKVKVATPAVDSHVLLALLGRFKGEMGDKYYLTPLTSCTNWGMEIQQWITMLVVAWDMRGVQSDPLFQDRIGRNVEIALLDGTMHKYLIQVQSKRPDLIPADVVIEEEYSLH